VKGSGTSPRTVKAKENRRRRQKKEIDLEYWKAR